MDMCLLRHRHCSPILKVVLIIREATDCFKTTLDLQLLVLFAVMLASLVDITARP